MNSFRDGSEGCWIGSTGWGLGGSMACKIVNEQHPVGGELEIIERVVI